MSSFMICWVRFKERSFHDSGVSYLLSLKLNSIECSSVGFARSTYLLVPGVVTVVKRTLHRTGLGVFGGRSSLSRAESVLDTNSR